MQAFVFILFSTLSVGFLALETLDYRTRYGSIKFNAKPGPDLVSGEFHHHETNLVLLFTCDGDGKNRKVSLSDANKNVIIKYLHTPHDISYIQLSQFHFIGNLKSDKILHLPNPELIPDGHELESHFHLYTQIEKLGNSNISLQHAFGVTALKREGYLSEQLSRALGEVFRPSGDQYPCVMELYMASLTLVNALSSLPNGNEDHTKHEMKRSGDCEVVNGETKNCPEKPGGNLCFGLCGPKAVCWEFVCKDCCYHQGCADHDTCCNELGMWSAKCVLPTDFNCDSYQWH